VCPHRSLPLPILQSHQTRHQVFGVFQRCATQRGGAHRRRPHYSWGTRAWGASAEVTLLPLLQSKQPIPGQNCELSGELGVFRTIAVRSSGMITVLSALVPLLSFRFRSRACWSSRSSPSDMRIQPPSAGKIVARPEGRWLHHRLATVRSITHCTDNARVWRRPGAPSIVAVTSVEPADRSARARYAR
jgi:hypothetical protein